MNIVKLLTNNFRARHQHNRCISTSSVNNGTHTFNKFRLIYPGTEIEKRRQKESPDRNIPFWSFGMRHPGYFVGNRFVLIPEQVADIIVPDLSGCEFKPYVSYRTSTITQEEFTAEDLFDAVYAPKIEKDFVANKLDEVGNPLEPSAEEKMTSEEAYIKARQTGSDYFVQDKAPSRAEKLNIA